jgi:hypothetical protein
MHNLDYELGFSPSCGDEYSEAAGATALRATCKLACERLGILKSKSKRTAMRRDCRNDCDRKFEQRIETGSLFKSDAVKLQEDILNEETAAYEEQLRAEEEAAIKAEEDRLRREAASRASLSSGSTGSGASSGSTDSEASEGMSNGLKYGLIGGGALILIVGIALIAKKK